LTVTEEDDLGSDADSLLRRVAQAPPIATYEPVGQLLAGRYRVLELLGRGGMGRVYEAEDLELGRRVAVKLVRAEAGEGRDYERLFHERSVGALLEHPGIVPIYDAGVAPNGEPFFVMRRARGERLDQLIARAGGVRARLALVPHVAAVAEAVAFAHRRGIVHGDLKPANVLLGESGEALVADWGLARRVGDGERAARAGTAAYLAPERAAGGPADERGDVYALGATLFHVLAGRPPGADAEAALAGVPAAAVAIARKALAAAPEARHAGAAELAAALRALETRGDWRWVCAWLAAASILAAVLGLLLGRWAW
jgi:eukaryotic-like serine/threonine-protein kinase